VCDEEHRQALLPLYRFQKVQDFDLNRHVQRGHRFICYQQPRTGREGASDYDSLELSAREFIRIAFGGGRIELHSRNEFMRARARCSRLLAIYEKSELD